MESIIRFLAMGDNDNKKYARERLMEIADKLDEHNKELNEQK